MEQLETDGNARRNFKKQSFREDALKSTPEIFKPTGRHVRVTDRVLDILVPQVGLQRSRVVVRAKEYFERFPKVRYQTEVESWRDLQSQNIEFTMKRLREPIEAGD